LYKYSLSIAALLAGGVALAAPEVDPALPDFSPSTAAAPPAGADYLLPDGSVGIFGAEHAEFIIEGIDKLFEEAHKGAKFSLKLQGTSTAMPALSHGVSPFVPMGRNVTPIELVPYQKLVGAKPLEIRVAHASVVSQKAATDLAVYVNQANPLDKVSIAEILRIFMDRQPEGAISRWGQLGVGGDQAKSPIHPVFTPEYTGFGSYLRLTYGHEGPFAANLEKVPNTKEILKYVGEDKNAIGIAATGRAAPGVKMLSLALQPGGDYAAGTPEEVVSGKYPLGRYLYFYVRQEPGKPLDPFVKEWLRLLLSKQGQQVVASDPEAYLPLTAAEAAKELAKLDKIAAGDGAAAHPPKDGSVYIVGDDGMEDAVAGLNALYAKAHPGVRFTTVLKGSSTGIGGLTAGVSALAPMGRAAWAEDLGAFKEGHGYYPTDIHIGYDAFTHKDHKSPPAIYINAKNPLAGLTVEQLARIFTVGAPDCDITRWSQLGVGGDVGNHAIHLYGPADDGTVATSFRDTIKAKGAFSARYEALDKAADVVNAVANDPYGIAMAGFFDAAKVPGVRILPLAWKQGAPMVLPSYEEIHAGHYPLASYLRIYVDRAPGKPLDPLVKDYLRLALSKEGQAIIAAGKDDEQGLVPLDAEAVKAELSKLE